MAIKTICCISSKKDWHDTMQLCKRVKDKTGIEFSILSSTDAIIDYDTVIYIHSKNAVEDAQVEKWLKEASDLNKTFIPVIIGGNWLSNKLDILKYKGPNLRSQFLQLRKDEEFLELCNTLTSFSGKMLAGDAYGATVDFLFDIDTKIIKDGSVIAEIQANTKTPVTLYIGEHHLKYQPSIDGLFCKDDIVIISSVEEHKIVDYHFCEQVKVYSDILCDVFQNDRYVSRIKPNETSILALIAGTSKILFQSVDFPDYCTKMMMGISSGNNEPINLTFTYQLRVCADMLCDVFQNERLVSRLNPNEAKTLTFFTGDSKISFQSVEFPDFAQEYQRSENKKQPIVVKFTSKVLVKSDVSCHLYQDSQLIGYLDSEKVNEVSLFTGRRQLLFQCKEHPGIEKIIDVDIKKDDNSSIEVEFLTSIVFKSDVNGILKENDLDICRLNAYEPQEIKVFKGVHKYCFAADDVHETIPSKVVSADNKVTVLFPVSKIRRLTPAEKIHLSNQAMEQYERLIIDREILAKKYWESDFITNKDIESLKQIDHELDIVVNEVLTKKGISDVIMLLQSPIQNVLKGLTDRNDDIFDILYNLN